MLHIAPLPITLLLFILVLSVASLGLSSAELYICIFEERNTVLCAMVITQFICSIILMSVSIGLTLYIVCTKRQVEKTEKKELTIDSLSSNVKDVNSILEEESREKSVESSE